MRRTLLRLTLIFKMKLTWCQTASAQRFSFSLASRTASTICFGIARELLCGREERVGMFQVQARSLNLDTGAYPGDVAGRLNLAANAVVVNETEVAVLLLPLL